MARRAGEITERVLGPQLGAGCRARLEDAQKKFGDAVEQARWEDAVSHGERLCECVLEATAELGDRRLAAAALEGLRCLARQAAAALAGAPTAHLTAVPACAPPAPSPGAVLQPPSCARGRAAAVLLDALGRVALSGLCPAQPQDAPGEQKAETGAGTGLADGTGEKDVTEQAQ